VRHHARRPRRERRRDEVARGAGRGPADEHEPAAERLRELRARGRHGRAARSDDGLELDEVAERRELLLLLLRQRGGARGRVRVGETETRLFAHGVEQRLSFAGNPEVATDRRRDLVESRELPRELAIGPRDVEKTTERAARRASQPRRRVVGRRTGRRPVEPQPSALEPQRRRAELHAIVVEPHVRRRDSALQQRRHDAELEQRLAAVAPRDRDRAQRPVPVRLEVDAAESARRRRERRNGREPPRARFVDVDREQRRRRRDRRRDECVAGSDRAGFADRLRLREQ
jgi:hypothetical protein